MKKQLFILLSALLVSALSWAEVLEIPISLDLTSGGLYSVVSGTTPGEDTTITTTGTDPKVLTATFAMDYIPGATDKITFQYKSDAEIPHIQVFFAGVAGTPAAAKSITTTPIAAASDWTTYEISVGSHATWGQYSMFRVDFGNLSGITISMRAIKLVTSAAETNRVEFFYSMDETFLYGVQAASGSVNAQYIPAAVAANNISFETMDTRGVVMSNPAGNIAVSDVSRLETVGLTKGAANSDATYGTWIKLMPGASSVMQIIMANGPTTAGYRNILNVRYNATYTAARLETTLGTSGMVNRGDAAENYNIIPGEWTHIAVSSDNASKLLKLYINGDSVYSATVDGFAPTDQVRLGAHANLAGGYAQTMIGYMDDAFMFSRVLSTAEIKDLCDNRTIPANDCEFFYDFEGATSGPVSTDGPIASIYRASTIEANNYTSVDNDYSSAEGNNALSIPSTNTAVDNVACVETKGLINDSNNGDATYGMWVKPTSGETRPLQVLMSGVGGKTLLALRPTEAPNEGQLTLESSCDARAGLNFMVSSQPIDFDVWTHVALVTKTDGTIELYINGELLAHELVNSLDGNLTPAGFQSFSEIRLGAHPNLSGGSGQSFSGLMDDAFMYSKALDAAAIKALAGISNEPTSLRAIAQDELSLYPCPVMQGNALSINRPARIEGNASITIYNITGCPIYRTSSDQQQLSLDASLPSGQYVLKLSSAKETLTQSFIVQ